MQAVFIILSEQSTKYVWGEVCCPEKVKSESIDDDLTLKKRRRENNELKKKVRDRQKQGFGLAMRPL